MERNSTYSSFNPFFYLLFFIWVVAGGLAILLGDKEDLFRLFNGHHISLSDAIIPFVSKLGEGLPITVILASLLFIPTLRNRWYATAALACTILSALLTQAGKSLFNEPRPLNYFNKAEWIHILPGWKEEFHRSFPSGHTCGAFAMFCLLSCLLPKPYRTYGIIFFVLGLAVAYSRMYLAAHFFADVYAGSLVGVLFTTFILWLMRRYQPAFFRDGTANDKQG